MTKGEHNKNLYQQEKANIHVPIKIIKLIKEIRTARKKWQQEINDKNNMLNYQLELLCKGKKPMSVNKGTATTNHLT